MHLGHLGACPTWLLALVCVMAALVLAASLACCLCRCSGGACPPAGDGHAAGQSGDFCCVCVGGGPGDDCRLLRRLLR